jgi:hypothetical protein
MRPPAGRGGLGIQGLQDSFARMIMDGDATVNQLTALGVAQGRIPVEDFGWIDILFTLEGRRFQPRPAVALSVRGSQPCPGAQEGSPRCHHMPCGGSVLVLHGARLALADPPRLPHHTGILFETRRTCFLPGLTAGHPRGGIGDLPQRRAVDTRSGAVVHLSQARFGHRGYDEEHVLAFCALVERELATLLNEKASLWEEVERLRRRIIDSGDASGVRPEDAHIQAVRILSNAQQMADRYVADAQQYSRQITIVTRCWPKPRRTPTVCWTRPTAGPAAPPRRSRPSRAPRPTGNGGTARPNSPTSGRSARCTAPTCGPTWKPCSATWRTAGRSGPGRGDVLVAHPVLVQRLGQVRENPVDMLIGQPGQVRVRGPQVTPGIPVRAAQGHGQECRLLRDLPFHVHTVEIGREQRVRQNLAVENLGGGVDCRRTAQTIKET